MLNAEKRAGFALAALLADDRALRHVERVISPALAETLREELTQLGAHKTGGVARLLARVRPALGALPPLPPRAALLLAPHLPRARVQIAAPARPGFVPPPDLVPLLLRIARAECARRKEAT